MRGDEARGKKQKGYAAMYLLRKNRALWAGLLTITAVFVAVSAGYAAGPEKYPRKTITIIVPFAPGGAVYLGARLLADFLSKDWEVPVNVVTKEGGNTVIGTLEMMKSKPDGYTVLCDNNASCSFQVVLPDLPYKIQDRTYLANYVVSPMVLTVNGKSPWKDLRDVAAAAKKDPQNFKWGSLGGVSVADFVEQQFFAAAGIDPGRTKVVRFKGAGDAIVALAGGHIDFTSTGVAASLSYHQSGTARIIAFTGPHPVLPEVTTTAEQGFPAVNAMSRQGISGPPGVPKSVVTAWEQEIERLAKSPEFKERAEKIGFTPLFINSNNWRSTVFREAEEAKKFFPGIGK